MFAEDLTPFLSVSDFASAAVLDGVEITGILDTSYAEPLGNDVSGYAPAFMIATQDAPYVAQGQTLVVGGATYKVRGVEPDGTGITLLRLEVQ